MKEGGSVVNIVRAPRMHEQHSGTVFFIQDGSFGAGRTVRAAASRPGAGQG
jgi:hypothetical protein